MPEQMFELMYHKTKNFSLFETLENANTGLHNLQNYIPLYRRFFSLSDTNHNNINLNHKNHVISVEKGTTKNNVVARFESLSGEPKRVFIKYSPLLDPIKYLSGKYDMQSPDLLVLPSYPQSESTNSVHQKKMNDPNNSSYIDSFFTYLTSQVLNAHGFVHGLDFYGSFLANQDEYTVNVYDELEYFSGCDFFLKNRNELFRLDDTSSDMFDSKRHNTGTQSKMPTVKIGEDVVLEEDVLECNANTFNDLFSGANESDVSNSVELKECTDADMVVSPEESSKQTRHSKSSDSCSSRSSDDYDSDHNNDDDDDDDNRGTNADLSENEESCNDGTDEVDDDGDDDDDDDESEFDDEEVHNAHIFNFPVHAILMEKCENTLDSLMCGKHELTDPEWAAILMQVIMTLIAYQHMFAMTHNDLHTNNIMFVKTEKKFLHYLHKGIYYRVPTYGRIMKIIDFGRAIYTYRGETMVSDSFDRNGDAATQYNCEPYMNPKKPRLEPNPSFDLCRLACSLFDYFVEDIRDVDEYNATLKESRVASIVIEWLKDDKGRNVLYKKNGDERYPEFKLYKMIARTVHNAVPHEQLSKPVFAHFVIPRKQIKGKPHIMNIDALPCYKDAQQ
jgi:hypothetical protein